MEENFTKPGFVERRMKQMVEIAALESYPYYDGDNSIDLKREAFKNGLLSKAAKEYHSQNDNLEQFTKEIIDIINCIKLYDHTAPLEEKGKYFEVIQKDLKNVQPPYVKNADCFDEFMDKFRPYISFSDSFDLGEELRKQYFIIKK